MPSTKTAGAFHGAEVPFVFGFGLELKTDTERNLSKIMGCYWRSFMWHGDPSEEVCGAAVWPQFNALGSPHLELGADVFVQTADAELQARCELFNAWLERDHALPQALRAQVDNSSSNHGLPMQLFV